MPTVPQTLRPRQPKTGSNCSVLGKPPLIADTSTTICTRPNSRAAPLCPNLDGNLCPTLTAHLEPLPFFRISRNPGPGKISISQKSFGIKLNHWIKRCSFCFNSFFFQVHELKLMSKFRNHCEFKARPLARTRLLETVDIRNSELMVCCFQG